MVSKDHGSIIIAILIIVRLCEVTLESTATGRDVVNHIRGNIAPFGHHLVTKHKKSLIQLIDNVTKNVSKSPAPHNLLIKNSSQLTLRGLEVKQGETLEELGVGEGETLVLRVVDRE